MGDRLVGTDIVVRVRDAALAFFRRYDSQAVRSRADELAQEVATRFLEASQREPVENPTAWARAVARRVAADVIDSAVRAPRATELDDDVDASRLAVERFVAQGLSGSEQAIRREQAGRIAAALSPQELRLLMLDADGWSAAEIAVRLGYRNAATVRARLSQVRRRIRDAAVELGVDPGVDGHPRPY